MVRTRSSSFLRVRLGRGVYRDLRVDDVVDRDPEILAIDVFARIEGRRTRILIFECGVTDLPTFLHGYIEYNGLGVATVDERVCECRGLGVGHGGLRRGLFVGADFN